MKQKRDVLMYVVLFVFFSVLVSGEWTPNDFCVKHGNGSFEEYVDCKEYFEGLENPVNYSYYNYTYETVYINNTRFMNYSNNVTYIINNNFTELLDEEVLKLLIDESVDEYFLGLDLGEELELGNILTLEYVEDKFYFKEDIESKLDALSSDYREPLLDKELQLMMLNSTSVSSDDIISSVLAQLTPIIASNNITKENDNSFLIFLIVVVGVVGLVIFFVLNRQGFFEKKMDSSDLEALREMKKIEMEFDGYKKSFLKKEDEFDKNVEIAKPDKDGYKKSF